MSEQAIAIASAIVAGLSFIAAGWSAYAAHKAAQEARAARRGVLIRDINREAHEVISLVIELDTAEQNARAAITGGAPAGSSVGDDHRNEISEATRATSEWRAEARKIVEEVRPEGLANLPDDDLAVTVATLDGRVIQLRRKIGGFREIAAGWQRSAGQ